MPPKELGVSGGSEASKETRATGARTEIPFADLQRHTEHWYKDGSVILATDVHLFRIHKGILAKHSTFFNDMFEFPTGETLDVNECWEGVPVVRMVGDSDEEVDLVLRALYVGKFMSSLVGKSLSLVTLLLIISTKYDFREIQSDTIEQLKYLFPVSYDTYQFSMTFNKATCPHLFTLLSYASRSDHGPSSILPALYLKCDFVSLGDFVAHIHLLPGECAKNLLSGRELVLKNSYRKTMQAPEVFNRVCCSQSPQTICPERFHLLNEKLLDRNPHNPTIFPFLIAHVDVQQAKLCEKCADRYTSWVSSCSTGRQLWNRLSSVFGLGGWGNRVNFKEL